MRFESKSENICWLGYNVSYIQARQFSLSQDMQCVCQAPTQFGPWKLYLSDTKHPCTVQTIPLDLQKSFFVHSPTTAS